MRLVWCWFPVYVIQSNQRTRLGNGLLKYLSFSKMHTSLSDRLSNTCSSYSFVSFFAKDANQSTFSPRVVQYRLVVYMYVCSHCSLSMPYRSHVTVSTLGGCVFDTCLQSLYIFTLIPPNKLSPAYFLVCFEQFSKRFNVAQMWTFQTSCIQMRRRNTRRLCGSNLLAYDTLILLGRLRFNYHILQMNWLK